MTKKMRELQDQQVKLMADLDEVMGGEKPDTEKAAELLDQLDKLEKELATLERYENRKKAAVPAEDKAAPANVNGFAIMAKMLRGQRLTEEELAAVALDEKSAQQLVSGTNAANGENYLCPDDVDLAIRELRKTYVQARDYITVEPTSALTGKINFGSDPNTGLVAFDDGDALDDNYAPTFTQKTFTIKFYGAFIPVSQILEGAERANLISYLNRWFVKRAIISENTKIFTVLKAGYNSGTPKAITGIAGLKSAINKDLDPSCLIGGVIITNQDGYDCLDSEVDGEGRPVLQPDITNPSVKRLKGLPVIAFPTALLANVSSGHFPVIFGDLKAAAIMKLYKNMLIATSGHAAFTKAQNIIRVMEGFDVIAADTSAYIYGSMTATA